MRPTPVRPGPDQESVWDYPRPPRVEAVGKRIKIVFNDELIVDDVDFLVAMVSVLEVHIVQPHVK